MTIGLKTSFDEKVEQYDEHIRIEKGHAEKKDRAESNKLEKYRKLPMYIAFLLRAY